MGKAPLCCPEPSGDGKSEGNPRKKSDALFPEDFSDQDFASPTTLPFQRLQKYVISYMFLFLALLQGMTTPSPLGWYYPVIYFF